MMLAKTNIRDRNFMLITLKGGEKAWTKYKCS